MNDRYFEGKKYAMRQSKDGIIFSFVVHPDDFRPWMASDSIGTVYMVAAEPVEMPEEEQAERSEAERAMASAAMLVKEYKYQTWLLSHYPPSAQPSFVDDNERLQWTIATFKKMIGIESKKEIRDNPEKLKLFKAHIAKYLDAKNRGDV